jgi:hypothetical protein
MASRETRIPVAPSTTWSAAVLRVGVGGLDWVSAAASADVDASDWTCGPGSDGALAPERASRRPASAVGASAPDIPLPLPLSPQAV